MRVSCPLCAMDDVDLGVEGSAVCNECGHRWVSRMKAQSRGWPSAGSGWPSEIGDLIASAIADLLESQHSVTAGDIDAYLATHCGRDLQAVVDAGAHESASKVASNARGFFNKAWTEGTNPHQGRFTRTGTTAAGYGFRRRDQP